MTTTCSICTRAIDHSTAPYQTVHRCGSALLACAECCAQGNWAAAIRCEQQHQNECAGEGAREVG